MKVVVTSVHPTPNGLVLACEVWGPKNSWLRFAAVPVRFDLMTVECAEAWWDWADRRREGELEPDEVDVELF